MLQTESAAIGTVIENRAIVELPLNGRNYLQLASLTPGATTNGPSSSQGRQRMGGQRNSFALNVGGQRVHYNHYSLDGVENTDLNFNSYMLLPSVDALQEFKVEAGLFDAEYGRAIAQINASTKAGTNKFHGSVFQFVRDSALDAKNYFDPADRDIPPFTRKQYGVTAGGPVVVPGLVDGRNKLFFMFNWEGLREEKSLTASPSLPLSAWRNGDFSQLRDAAGNLVPIYDPATRVFDAAGNVTQAPTPFAGNIIPQSRIHPVSKGLLAFYPLPEQERTGANFTNHEARRADADQFTYRLDFVESSKSNWFFRHSLSHELGYDPFAIPDMGINTDTDVHQAVLANTRVLGSNKFNDLRLGYGKLDNAHISPRANTVNVVEELGINIPSDNPLYWGVPNIGITGLSGLGEESDAPFINHDTTIQIVDNFSWSVGEHAFKFGGELRRVLYDQIGGVVTRGRWAFDGRYTQNPLLPAANRGGAAFADFLLGHFNRSEGQVGAPIANFRSGYYALYVQDSWKVRPTLTINYGLRWEYDQPFYDKNDNIVNIDFKWDNSAEPVFVRAGTGDPYEGNPAFRLAPDVQYVRDGRFGRGAYRSDFNDFAPRLGIAWTPHAEDRRAQRRRHLLRARHRERRLRHRAQRPVHDPPRRAGRELPAESQLRAAVRADGRSHVHPGEPVRRALLVYHAVVARRPAGAARRDVRGGDLLRIRGRPSAPAHELQQPGTEPAAEHQQRPSVPEVREHSGDERARPLQLPRALSQGAAPLLAGRELPQLLLLFQVDRRRQRRPHDRRRLADAVQPVRPPARTRSVGLRLPQALDDVVDVGAAVRQRRTLAEGRRRLGSRARRLAGERHLHDAGRLSVHRAVRAGKHSERRRDLLSGRHGSGLAALGQRAQPHALVQHRRVRRSQPGREGRSAMAPSRGTR